MNSADTLCRYRSSVRSDYRCPESPLPDSNRGYCIFHETEKDAQEFQRRIAEKLDNKDYDFTGYCFPQDVGFERVVFKWHTHFDEATFKGYADFEGAIFMGEAGFQRATFEKNASFEGATIQWAAHFTEATFNGEAGFWRTTFERGASFLQATCEGHAHFEGATFKRRALLEDVTFERGASFFHATFEGHAFFGGGVFKGDVDFELAIFKGYADFSLVDLKAIVKFEDTKFKYPEDKEAAYRLSKLSYQREGQYDKAGDWYYEERVARWQSLGWWPPLSFLRKLVELVCFRLTCGYGERPHFVFGWAFAINGLFASLYHCIGHIESTSLNYAFGIGDAFYFSAVTFVTLGFGGPWYPSPEHWIKYLVMLEAFLGAFFIALFVMTFGRRMMR